MKQGLLFIVALMFIASTSQSQILCTDIIPDTILNTDGAVYYLDLNNDGFADFSVAHAEAPATYCCYQYQNQGCTMSSQFGNAVLVTPQSSNITVNNFGQLISANSSEWSEGADKILANESHICTPFGCSSSILGLWSDVNDKYVAVRMKDGTDTLYGYLHLSVGLNGADVTIMDYAYNSVSGDLLHAGDTCTFGTVINETESGSAINIFPNPFSLSATILISLPESQKVSLRIFDVEGRLVKTIADEELSEGDHPLLWNATFENGSAVPNGIYFLRMKTPGESKTTSLSVTR